MTRCPHCGARPRLARVLRRCFRHDYRCVRCDKKSRFDTNQLHAVGFAAIVTFITVRVLFVEREDTWATAVLIAALFLTVITTKSYLVRLHPAEEAGSPKPPAAVR